MININYKENIDVATGRKKGDLLIKNGKIVNVFSGEIEENDLLIFKDRIVAIGKGYEAEKEIDINGSYILPGLIDTHVHIESSMVMPEAYGDLLLKHGVTTVISDPHEIANACGTEGIKAFVESAKNTDLDIKFMAPSCVPAVPFEESGHTIEAEDIKKLIKDGYVFGLGEVMNYPGVVSGAQYIFDKIDAFKDNENFVIDGHAPLIKGKELNAYAMYIDTDHECREGNEMIEKLSRGMYIQIREGTLCRDLDHLIPHINDYNYKRCLFCSDDKYLGDIIKEGTIDHNIRKTIQYGIDPVKAISIGTLNAAECYKLKNRGAIAPNYFADIVISKDLELTNIEKVFKNGKEVVNDKVYTKTNVNEILLNTVKHQDLKMDDFKFHLNSEKVRAIHVEPRTIKTDIVEKEVVLDKDGNFACGKDSNLSKIMVIERYGKSGNIGYGLVDNINIKNGAIATTISHDSHNIIVVGDNDIDMFNAVKLLGTSGGMSISINSGLEQVVLELEVGGLVSTKPLNEVLEKHEELHDFIDKLSVTKNMNPFMTLSFISLIVIDDIRINTKGLFDVIQFKAVSSEI